MEKYINEVKSEENMGDKVLIGTLYTADPILVATHRLGPDRLILLVNEELHPKQKDALKSIKGTLGNIIDIKEVKIDVYNIPKIAKKVVEIIDMQPKDDKIYVNVTSGRKTQALGLLYAAYARPARVKKIAYNPEEDKKAVVYLPKLSFNLTTSESEVLESIAKNPSLSITALAEKVGISRAMLYRNIIELKNTGLVIDSDGELKISDAGEIARL
ncbi:CRISPR locus-related DNA-binding protein [Candidatus Woesearchaeota archaeon]|jgi:CRISPR locus-related DNA-binding protein|nr:CRISPR locus-related DNA-binding protein [Candidatus Woesearchaeota archaeon]